jgi:hypothetical protein
LDGELIIDHRFRGFSDVALGGYVGGLLAAQLGPSAQVTLRAAVPVGRPLVIQHPTPDRLVLEDDGVALAEAETAGLQLEAPDAVSLAEAEEAAAEYPGFFAHPVPECFCCGPDREPGDGLRIFPGPAADPGVVAAPWVPDPSLTGSEGHVLPRFVWAALDCPQLWSLMVSAPPESDERVVTAAMAVRQDAAVKGGEPHVVMAWPMGREGRSLFSGGAVFSADGDVLVAARQRAVVVAGRGVPLGLAGRGVRTRP